MLAFCIFSHAVSLATMLAIISPSTIKSVESTVSSSVDRHSASLQDMVDRKNKFEQLFILIPHRGFYIICGITGEVKEFVMPYRIGQAVKTAESARRAGTFVFYLFCSPTKKSTRCLTSSSQAPHTLAAPVAS